VIEDIPSALLDRMELVQIDGYTEDGQGRYRRDFLLPRQRDARAADGRGDHGDQAALAQDRRDTPANRRAAVRRLAGQGAA